MRRSPLPHPLHVLPRRGSNLGCRICSTKALAGQTASLHLTLRRRTILLASSDYDNRGQTALLQHRHLQRRVAGFMGLEIASLKTPASRPASAKKISPGRKRKKKRRRVLCELGKRRRNRKKTTISKPADSPHFQTAADHSNATTWPFARLPETHPLPVEVFLAFGRVICAGRLGGLGGLFTSRPNRGTIFPPNW